MKIGLGQLDIVWENKRENKIKCEKMIKEAKEKGVDFIIFPEMTLTGFSMNTDFIAEIKEESESLQFFKKQAKENNIAIGFGIVFKGVGKKANNNFIIVNENGEEICDYTKIHPFSFGEEERHYKKGNKLSDCIIKGTRVSPLICYDLRFPEVFQVCSNKSELIVIIANWPHQRRAHWFTLLKARAIENQCFIAGINRCGFENGVQYMGDSMIVDPYGEIITRPSDKEGIIIKDIDTSIAYQYRNEFKLKEDRRVKFYVEMYSKK